MKTALTLCEHCRTPFQATPQESRFCCAGCSFVHGMILAGGMEKFYDLRGSATILPAGNAVLLQGDTAWAADALRGAEAGTEGELVERVFDVQGVSCVGCVWLIEAAFLKMPGTVRCFVDSARGRVTLKWCRGAFDLPAFVTAVGSYGYRLAPESPEGKPAGASGLRLGLCGALALNAMAFTLPRYAGMESGFILADFFELIAAFSATVSLLAGGGYFVRRAWSAVRLRRLVLDVPIAIGVVAAWLGSLCGWLFQVPDLLYFDFVAVFIFLMMLGRRMQEVSVAENRRRLLQNDPGLREVEIRGAEGDTTRVPASTLKARDEYRVPPGGAVPVASMLLAPRATLGLDWITGEPEPVRYLEGAVLPAGAIHLGQDPLPLRACEAWPDSLLAHLLETDPDAVREDPAARWLDRTLRIYLMVILITAFTGAMVWVFSGAAWSQALQVFVSVLVVSCPCALGVAVPFAHELAVARLRDCGLFVRTPDFWGRLLRVKRIVFDKTGTLTLDIPRLANPGTLSALPDDATAALATLVSESRHPVSAGLRAALASQGRFQPGAVRAVEIAGHGLRFEDAGGRVWELRRPYDREARAGMDKGEEDQPSGDCLFTRDGKVLAAFRFEEEIRAGAREGIGEFREAGLEVYLLSGDRESKVNAMARALGIPGDHAFARQTPEDKGAWMRAHGRDALFIGDGANDTLAAREALCSGTLTVERTLLARQSDFYFLSRGLRPLHLLSGIARRRRGAVVRAFTLALGYNFGVLVLALAGRMNPLLAAVLMPLSSLATLFIVTLTLRLGKPGAAQDSEPLPSCGARPGKKTPPAGFTAQPVPRQSAVITQDSFP